MRNILIILFFSFCSQLRGQYVAHWDVTDQSYVISYEIQQSLNNADWITVNKIQPIDTQTSYVDTFNVFMNNYYRIAAITKYKTYFSPSVLVYNTLPIILTDVKFKVIQVRKGGKR